MRHRLPEFPLAQASSNSSGRTGNRCNNNTIRKGNPALIFLKSGFDGRKFVLSLTGQVGRSVALETSTDLVNWLPAQSATFEIRQLTLTDLDASNFTRRFYRVYCRPILYGE